MDDVTRKLQRESERIASKYRLPDFYSRFKAPRALARKIYFNHPMAILLRKMVGPILQEDLGHGLYHCSRVSIDSATLICVEMEFSPVSVARKERLMVLGTLAGLLHDICRGEEMHAEAGAVQAYKMLDGLPLRDDEISCICQSIANHEAFHPSTPCNAPWIQLVSDCLYDADKFRWGRDTFTHTLWHMVDSRKMTPNELIEKFPWGMTGVMRIVDTFRTTTGRHYGPEIIETGVEIGKEIYHYLLQHT